MPPLTHLRSDYPLNLTLLEHLHTSALTWFNIAGLTSPRTIPASLIRHNHLVPISIYCRSCANSCSFACAPMAGKSTSGLTRARASVRELRLHIDEQLKAPSNTDVQIRTATFNSIPVSCGLRCCSVNHCHVSLLGSVFKRRTARKECTSVLSSCVAPVRRHRSKSSQLRRNTSCLKVGEQ